MSEQCQEVVGANPAHETSAGSPVDAGRDHYVVVREEFKKQF